MDGDWIIVVAVGVGAAVLGYLLLSLAVGVFVHALATAVDLFSWAAESGFIGVALYIIVWAIAAPFMVVVRIVDGAIRRERGHGAPIRSPPQAFPWKPWRACPPSASKSTAGRFARSV